MAAFEPTPSAPLLDDAVADIVSERGGRAKVLEKHDHDNAVELDPTYRGTFYK